MPAVAPLDSNAPELPRWVLLTGVLTVVALVYLPTVTFGFVYDDRWTIVGNGFLRVPSDLGLLLTKDAAALHVPDSFRPTLVAFDALAYQLFGLHAPTHHAVSIALHLGVCAVIAQWLRGLAAPLPLAMTTVAVIGTLAVHAEAVTMISFREDLLAALLGLLAMVVASRSLSSGPRARLAQLPLAGLLMALATGAKMSAAAVPLLFWLVESLSPWRPTAPRGRRLVATLCLVAGVVIALVLVRHTHGAWTPYGGDDNLRLHASRAGLSAVLAASTQIHLGYLQQMLIPLGLSPEYVDQGASWTAPATLFASAALAGLLACGLYWARARPQLSLAILGAFILALPTSNLFAMPNMRADRFMYLPSLPVCLGVAIACLGLGRLAARRFQRQSLLVVPAVLVVIVQGGVAQATTHAYRSDSQLWEVALRRAPSSARANAMAGLLLLGTVRREEQGSRAATALPHVRAHCARAERLDPLYELPQLCYARLATAEKRWAEAYERFDRALQLSVDRNDRILAALAQVSLDLPSVPGSDPKKHVAVGLAHLERALREYPYSSEVHAVAGQIYHRLGHPDLARAHYDRARLLHPERWDIVFWGLELEVDLGHAAAARQAWAKLHQDPVLEGADAASRSAMAARIRDAQHLFQSPDKVPRDPLEYAP
jgi:tetratricopeptide (TPR) repeat protein